MITQEDAKKLIKEMDRRFATKEDLNLYTQSIAKEIEKVIDMVGDLSKFVQTSTKEIHSILDNHERRLDKLDDKVFA